MPSLSCLCLDDFGCGQMTPLRYKRNRCMHFNNHHMTSFLQKEKICPNKRWIFQNIFTVYVGTLVIKHFQQNYMTNLTEKKVECNI